MTAAEVVGKKQEHLLQTLILNNGSGTRILMKIWNEQINRVKDFIRPNLVIFYNY